MRKTDTEIKEALIECRGNLSLAARALGCDRGTIYRRMKKKPDILEARDDAEERRLDEYEAAIDKAALEEGKVDAIKYVLSTRGKKRGYSERENLPALIGTGISISCGIAPVNEDDEE